MCARSASCRRACALRVCIALCLLAGSEQISIKEFSVPEAVQLGTDAELQCRYELAPGEQEEAVYIKWWWSPHSDNMENRTLIYQHIIGYDPLVQKNATKIEIKDHDTIVLMNVTPVNSGTYECEVSNIDEIRKHATLTVFSEGSGPSVNTSMLKGADNETLRLLIECEAEMVAPKPDLIISVNGKTIETIDYVKPLGDKDFYDIYANSTLTLEDTEEKDIRCELTYVNDKIPHQPYVDVLMYVPPGTDEPSTTETPLQDSTEDATRETLQNPSDDGIQLISSWTLLIAAFVTLQLQ